MLYYILKFMIKLDKCAMHYICGDNVCFIPNLEETESVSITCTLH